MSMIEITNTRYALVDGSPVEEKITFRWMPEEPRSRPNPAHDGLGLVQVVTDPETSLETEVPLPNLWFFLSFTLEHGVPLFVIPVDGTPHPEGGTLYPDNSTYWAPYDLPLRTGVVIVTQEVYASAVAALEVVAASATSAGIVTWLATKQATWDDSSALLDADGLGTASILALLGPRPV